MKINNLIIKNFRGIAFLEVHDLGDTVIIAGQNGAGKSNIFDAIRLLKTCYGGYDRAEWQKFFQEFDIQFDKGNPKNLADLFYDPSKPVVIECHFKLRDNERNYISANAKDLFEEAIWREKLPETLQREDYKKLRFSSQFRERQPEVNNQIEREIGNLLQEIEQELIIGKIEITPAGNMNPLPSRLLQIIFTLYKPKQIGVIDHHAPQRHYGRENIHGVNFTLSKGNDSYIEQILYNSGSKYSDVKGEIARNYVKQLLAEKADPNNSLGPNSLSHTLQKLFNSFFPEKEFLGPLPTIDGNLKFPVKTKAGVEHDLDGLSSGEKEILYGYLRIYRSEPLYSIILIDEPELHLNPRLIRELPEFYQKYLGEGLENQIWLITHSDALIHEVVGKPKFSIFHMLPSGREATGVSQLRPLQDVEAILADLIGFAAYLPNGKCLMFEGGGDSDFDKTLAKKLFPKELKGINLISATDKSSVKSLHEILDRAYRKQDLPMKFYAIVDSDSDEVAEDTNVVNRFRWDVYHIENYLLDVETITYVVNSINLGQQYDEIFVLEGLKKAAEKVIPSILIHKMTRYVNSQLTKSIDLKFNPETRNIGLDLYNATLRSFNRITAFVETVSEISLATLEQDYRKEIEQSFLDDTWKNKLPGKEILTQFVNLQRIPIKYKIFRNLIIRRMEDTGFQPSGMKTIIDHIQADRHLN